MSENKINVIEMNNTLYPVVHGDFIDIHKCFKFCVDCNEILCHKCLERMKLEDEHDCKYKYRCYSIANEKVMCQCCNDKRKEEHGKMLKQKMKDAKFRLKFFK